SGNTIFFGTIPAVFGVPSRITLPSGIIAMFFIIRYFGKVVPDKLEDIESGNSTDSMEDQTPSLENAG
ncbi:MAG: hypothetical protein IH948_07970, partial [Bacteroidetes bacterium]|nr:hypothetical protein [Bacteroidota bacterium]